MDSSRIALALESMRWVNLSNRHDVCAAFEAVMVSRESDRAVFRELFDRYFQAPAPTGLPLTSALAASPAPVEEQAPQRALDALTPGLLAAQTPQDDLDEETEEDMTADARFSASQRERLQQADFRTLDAWEYRQVERWARNIRGVLPQHPGRRTRAGSRGSQPHWPRALREAARLEGEVLRVPRRTRRKQPLPVLVLVDVSGSMERYTRLLMAFLHAATRDARRRDVFAIGTTLTDLTAAFRQADTDRMLAEASQRIPDFAGGTRLGSALTGLLRHHARRLVGRRTVTLLITDGLDTGEPAELDAALSGLKRHTGRLLWLNPMLRFDGYQPLARGARVMSRQVDSMLPVHNLDSLQSLAHSLQRLLQT
ncbi:MAG: VWA domain-containing protein [Betaproteobacteria bacterium]|nr:VWA domain-containing protein [Betaproteobacteria bacterium]